MISIKLDNTNKIHKCLPEKKGGRVEGLEGMDGKGEGLDGGGEGAERG